MFASWTKVQLPELLLQSWEVLFSISNLECDCDYMVSAIKRSVLCEYLFVREARRSNPGCLDEGRASPWARRVWYLTEMILGKQREPRQFYQQLLGQCWVTWWHLGVNLVISICTSHWVFRRGCWKCDIIKLLNGMVDCYSKTVLS